MPPLMTLHRAAQLAIEEATRATTKYPPFNSPHEGFAVLKEEVDEPWDAIKSNNRPHARLEAIQVAAMALRYLADIPAE